MRISDWSSDVCSSDLPYLMRRTEDVARETFAFGIASDVRPAPAVGRRISRAATHAEHIGAGSEQEKGGHAEDQDRPATHLASEQHWQEADQQPAETAASAAAETAAAPAKIANIVSGIIIVEAHRASPPSRSFRRECYSSAGQLEGGSQPTSHCNDACCGATWVSLQARGYIPINAPPSRPHRASASRSRRPRPARRRRARGVSGGGV